MVWRCIRGFAAGRAPTGSAGFPENSSDGRADRAPLFAALLLVFIAHSPSVGAPFVWDDHALIVNNAAITHPAHLVANSFWGSPTGEAINRFYRPVTALSYAANWRMSRDPAAFHLTNVLLHLTVCALVYARARAMKATTHGAAALAALFGLFPRLTESVSWISGRTDVLATLFLLASIVLDPGERRGSARGAASALLLLLALLSKEIAVAAAAFVVSSEWTRPAGGGPQGRPASRLGTTAVVISTYLVVRAFAMRGALEGGIALPLGILARVRAGLEAVGWYVAMMANPWRPQLMIGVLDEPNVPVTILGAVTVAGLVWLAIEYRGALRRAGVLPEVALATMALGLVAHVIPYSREAVAADRFLYLPLAAALLALVRPIDRMIRARLGRVVVMATCLLFAVATYRRGLQWRDPVALWADAAQRSGGVLPRINYARVLIDAGRPVDALRELSAVGAAPARWREAIEWSEARASAAVQHTQRVDPRGPPDERRP